MPLSPPPDYTKAVLALALGAAVAVCLFTLTRSNLPHVGDNIHSLPHGGNYRDGTKQIMYGAPGKSYPSINLFSGSSKNNAFCVVVFLVFLIAVASRFGSNRSCVHCRVAH
ncbi:triple gene block protein 2 [Birch carlavirus]|uniref:Movement protein TGB2 n=1 Tax=Birch carlavirus TaxID=2248769 RepID=A0AAE5YIE0_9VIRU|nr:triple gene block protein 2 [Birch carlavirus]QBJ27540.1 triple gene block protein 2 [Birch carlavirus]